MDNKVKVINKFLPSWFSIIWFFGVISALLMYIPNKESQWALAHMGLIYFIYFGTCLFVLCMIAVIFFLIKKYELSKFQVFLFYLSLLCIISIIIKSKK